jgi:hypothetical protein
MKTRYTIEQIICWDAVENLAAAGECIVALMRDGKPVRDVGRLTNNERMALVRDMNRQQVAA